MAELQQKAGMPRCGGASIRITERIPGGGADGSGLGLEVTMSEGCLDRWIENLDADERFGHNFSHGGYMSGFAECGQEVIVWDRLASNKAAVGLITDFGGNIRECHD
jgi:hypothetical protein